MLFPALAVAAAVTRLGAAVSEEDNEFFENRIRPVLAQECYECHRSGAKTKGGLALDWRDAMLAGGDSGPAIVPGDPDASLLLRTIRHEIDDLHMPKDGAKLEDEVLADFEKWIRSGAPDPRTAPPTDEQLEAETSWPAVLERRRQWWSFQPVDKPELPRVRNGGWSSDPVDRFILARLEEAGLEPAARAERWILLRRLSHVLTGLPPSEADLDAFLADNAPGAWERAVDAMLASPRFGERWARHWMDWFRYSDSHGSEGDPAIPFAWRYRDYLIRALNADVPYDQLVREHVAGDLLTEPRTDESGELNESALGTAHFRFVFHGFAPTDALDELVRFTDNQIDVVTKAFMGLTVSCARCHDHKFDAVSQEDFYALFGIFASCRPATRTLDLASRGKNVRERMTAIKSEIRDRLAAEWERFADRLPEELETGIGAGAEDVLEAAAGDPSHPLHVWALLRRAAGERDENDDEATRKALEREWQEVTRRFAEARESVEARLAAWRSEGRTWEPIGGEGVAAWSTDGTGVRAGVRPAGEFDVALDGDRIVGGIFPAVLLTHALSTQDNGIAASPTFRIRKNDRLFVRVAGGGGARLRYVVQNYPRQGTVYPIRTLDASLPQWSEWDLSYWEGDNAHVEVSTALDQPVEIDGRGSRSWFAVTEAAVVPAGGPVPAPGDAWAEILAPLVSGGGPQGGKSAEAPASLRDAAATYAAALRSSIAAWRSGSPSDAEARFLGAWLARGLLPNSLDALPGLRARVEEFRRTESTLPQPQRAPGVIETAGFDQPFFERGDHKRPGAPVPRRFLDAIDPEPYHPSGSGRLELAGDIASAANPFTARVAVNRAWHHVFGRGLVATTDNFGRLGEKPTHPELLDYLAATFAEDGWSLKRLIRRLVLTETFQLDSTPPARAGETDPDNRLLSHASIRRVEGEGLRDAMLMVSGRLDPTMSGPGVDGNSPRRSVYVRVVRNDLDPFLSVFDFPEPLTTRGRRNVTNVPGQSLTLLNSPFVADLARAWIETEGVGEAGGAPAADEARIRSMFRSAFARQPSPGEIAASLAYLRDLENEAADAARRHDDLRGAIDALRAEREAIIGPVRLALAGEAGAGSSAHERLAPVAAWDFSDPGVLGNPPVPLRLHGDARIEDGALVVSGAGHAEAGPLPGPLRAKSLEVRVLLDSLEQAGGGVMNVQSPDGGVFDAIVFGEQSPGHWLAGSNVFARTKPFAGAQESEADMTPVHLVITYAADGTIACYRNGEPYGNAYRSDGPVDFAADSRVLFGCRHSPPGGNRMLRGRILEAFLYDRALTADEVLAAAADAGDYLPPAVIEAALPEDQRERIAALDAELARLEEERQTMEAEAGTNAGTSPRTRAWADFAQSLFNAKEFIYLR